MDLYLWIVKMMVMGLGETCWNDEGGYHITWFYKLRKNLYKKKSIYFALLVHRQEYRNELENEFIFVVQTMHNSAKYETTKCEIYRVF
jgi:hypothetical protein